VAQDGEVRLLGRAPHEVSRNGDLLAVEDPPEEDGQGEDPLLGVAPDDDEPEAPSAVRRLGRIDAS
jgi:hypothetical protein